MIVVCLEGCHGSGKSSLTQQLQEAGYPVLDEMFMDMPKVNMHPQSLVMESVWTSRWFERLLRLQTEHEAECKRLGVSTPSEQIFFADRSPYSAVFYAKNGMGSLLEPLIKHQIDELRANANIHIYTVLISVERNLLWSRIQQRLALEPQRAQYNEGSRDWMDTTVNFYEQRDWDFIISNHGTLQELLRIVIKQLCMSVKRFEASSPQSVRSLGLIEDSSSRRVLFAPTPLRV
eukprot:GCRY01003219.1.p1 GENE.GCRY01003219.1~~GCRY01003219.1.p1  ORF type:complete len:233 (-),score=11.54 GCRY01003219.1:228-926(-)